MNAKGGPIILKLWIIEMQAPYEQTVHIFDLSVIYFLVVFIDLIPKPIKPANISTSGFNISSKSSNILVLRVSIYRKNIYFLFICFFNAKRSKLIFVS